MIVDSLKKDGVKFRNSELEKLNKRIILINSQYQEKQSELVASLVAKVGGISNF